MSPDTALGTEAPIPGQHHLVTSYTKPALRWEPGVNVCSAWTAACPDHTVCRHVTDADTRNMAVRPGGRAGIGVSACSMGPTFCPAGLGFPASSRALIFPNVLLSGQVCTR